MISLVRIAEPETTPVSVAELKAHARIVHDSEDTYLAGVVASATRAVEERVKRSLVAQGWRLTTEPVRCVWLPRPPLVSVDEVRTVDSAGVETVVDPAEYVVNLDAGTVTAVSGWSGVAVVVEYTAGYTELPADLKHGVLFLAALWYGQREPVTLGGGPAVVPQTLGYILEPYRVRNVP